MAMPDADAYWRSFHDTRARAAHLWALRRDMADPVGRHEVETFLFHFRMFIESFCVMARYGRLAHDALSKTQRKAYHPREILDAISDLQDVRFIALDRFAVAPDSTDADIGFDIAYGAHVAIDTGQLARLHGRLGGFAHVTGVMPDAAPATALMEACVALYARLAPLLQRHLLEVTDGPRANDATLAGLALLVGRDDRGRDWFVEWEGADRITVRLCPPLD